MRRTVHLVYPSGVAISCPAAIGRHVAERLERHYRVLRYDWDEIRVVRPEPGDVLVGHPHPAPWTVFRMSNRLAGWRRKIVLCPYAHGFVDQVAHLDAPVRRADLFLAITGPYWACRAAQGPFSHWAPKIVPVDLAVDRRDFPRVKHAFAPPGRRRFLYVGSADRAKNVSYLTAIARAMPEAEVAWAGSGAGQHLSGIRALGFLDFATEEALRLVAEYDFLLTVGRSDANPATILEAMAWGLVPICTPQSGYEREAGIVNVPLDDVAGAVQTLRELQQAPAEQLSALREANDRALETRFTWDRFARQVLDAIESNHAPAPGAGARWTQARLAWRAALSPYSPLRPGNALALLRRNATRLAQRRSKAEPET